MSNYELIAMQEVSNIEAAEIIEEKAKSAELTYREEKVALYLKKFSKMNKKDFLAAKEEILSLQVPRLDVEHIVKILDIMPKNGTELRAIVSHSGTIIVDENVKKIQDILKKYQ